MREESLVEGRDDDLQEDTLPFLPYSFKSPLLVITLCLSLCIYAVYRSPTLTDIMSHLRSIPKSKERFARRIGKRPACNSIPKSDERFARQQFLQASISVSTDFSFSEHRSPSFGFQQYRYNSTRNTPPYDPLMIYGNRKRRKRKRKKTPNFQ